MSLFRKAGKKFEETKRAYLTDENAPFRCTACDTGLNQEYDTCPHCGEDAVEAMTGEE